jgi:hypothetical protein
MKFQQSIENMVKNVQHLTDLGTKAAWGYITIADLMVRAITDGIDIEFAVTDGEETYATDDLNDLLGAVEYALDEFVIF